VDEVVGEAEDHHGGSALADRPERRDIRSLHDAVMAPTITPELGYRDPHAAIQWLTEVLGFKLSLVIDDDEGGVAHAELSWRTGVIFLGGREQASGPAVVCLTAEDASEVDRMYERVVEAGGEIPDPPSDTPFGSHQFTARDAEGNLWTVGTYQPKVSG
jgi:uncharacterized glyoxalase superfamily protein PhnB